MLWGLLLCYQVIFLANLVSSELWRASSPLFHPQCLLFFFHVCVGSFRVYSFLSSVLSSHMNFRSIRSSPNPSGCPSLKNNSPCCLLVELMTWIESPAWRLFTDGGLKRQAHGTDAAAWKIAAVSPDNFVRILCGPVTCDPRHPAFSGATSCSNNTAELTGFAAALRWISVLSLVVNGCVSSTTLSTLRVLPLVSLTLEDT